MALTEIPIELSSTPSIVDGGNATAITIDASENVGIGTASPRSILDLDGGSETQLRLQTTNSGSAASDGLLISLDSSTNAKAYIWNYENAETIFGTNNAERMRIDSSGNVGIGGAPASLLDVFSTGEVISTVRSTSTSGARQATLRLNVPSTGGDDPAGRVQFTYGTGYTVAGSIEMTHTNRAMKFLSGTTEAMRIDASGNLLVGKSVNDNSTVGGSLRAGESTFTAGNSRALTVGRNTNDGELIQFRKGNNSVGSIGVYSSDRLFIGAGDTNITFKPSHDIFYPSTAAGTARDNAIDLGDSGARFKDIYLSGGVYVGGTGAANKLDDYEEGYWTPTILGSTGGAQNMSSALGSYTKIGNLIHLTFYIGASSLGNATGNIRVGGIPYSALSGGTTNSRIVTGSCMVDGLLLTAGRTWVHPYMSHASNDIKFYQSGSNVGWIETPVDANWTMIGGITYRTV
jgi:hypothetical protein